MKRAILLASLIVIIVLPCQANQTFVSIPDFVNKNRLTPEEQKLAEETLRSIANEDPKFVLCAGDLIGGYWYSDKEKATSQAKKSYQRWLQRWEKYNLKVYPIMGDHELGDLPTVNLSLQTFLIPTYKKAYQESFDLPKNGPEGLEELTYYIELKNTLIISVHTFSKPNFWLKPQMSERQLRWLEDVLRQTKKENIIVQGHVPILPVDGGKCTSKVRYFGGSQSRFWRIMVKYGVDMYLCGEFHTIDIAKKEGVTQVVHGSYVSSETMNYLVIETGNSLEYKLKVITR